MQDNLQLANAACMTNEPADAPHSVTVFDLSDRTQIEITGVDRAKFLHGFCTNDIKRLSPGQGCEALLTNIKGRVLGHLFVFAGPDSLWLDTVPEQESAIITHLDRYLIREDVQLTGRSNARGELFVTGSAAPALLMLDDSLPLYGVVSRTAFEHPFEIRRVDLLGEPGFLMSLPRAAVESTLHGLLAVGCARGTADEFETRRIEAGFPFYGADITEDNLAQEVARTKHCISFTKGCYLGQEPIARLDAMGHTNQELRRIRFRPGVSVARGSRLLAAESDDEAGEITSVAPLPDSVGQTTCLGYLKTRFHRPDTQVRIAGAVSATRGIVLAVDE